MRTGKLRKWAAAAAAAALPGIALAGAGGPPARHAVTPDDLMALVSVHGLACSADGRTAAWEATTSDIKADKRRSRIWLADLAIGAPRAITAADSDAGSPQFSPDGRSIAFTATRGKDEHDQIWLLDRQGGEAERLTALEGDISAFRFSPDGKRLVIAMTDAAPKPPADDPKRPLPLVIDDVQIKQDTVGFLTATSHDHLWLFDMTTRKLSRLTAPGPWDEGAMEWSPDGREIAFVASHRTDPAAPDTQWLEIVAASPDAQTPAVQPRVVARFGSTSGQALVWSADGKRIVHAVGLSTPKTNDYSQPLLAETDLTTGVTRPLPAAVDKEIANPVPLGKGLVGGLLSEDRREFAVTIDPATGAFNRLNTPAVAIADQCPANDGGKGPRAVIASADGSPSEVHVLNGAKLTRLSAHNVAVSDTVAWSVPEDFSARASDGNDVHGMLFRPAGYQPGKRYPTVLWIHGGPTGQDGHDLEPGAENSLRQMLAAQGYAVLAVNYRGSSGRGQDYSATIAADWGNKEVKDLDAAIAWAEASGIADPDRLMVGGWSYGGILTDFLIVREPRFKAAMSGAGEGNILALFGVDQYVHQYWQEIGLPWQNPDVWLKLSEPLLHADRVRTPTLFMGGMADDNVPLVGGQQMYQALRLTGVPTRLVAYPGAFHGIHRPSFMRDRMDRIIAWFASHQPK